MVGVAPDPCHHQPLPPPWNRLGQALATREDEKRDLPSRPPSAESFLPCAPKCAQGSCPPERSHLGVIRGASQAHASLAGPEVCRPLSLCSHTALEAGCLLGRSLAQGLGAQKAEPPCRLRPWAASNVEKSGSHLRLGTCPRSQQAVRGARPRPPGSLLRPSQPLAAQGGLRRRGRWAGRGEFRSPRLWRRWAWGDGAGAAAF